MINTRNNEWIPSEGFKYLTNGTVWTESLIIGRSDNIENWHDTNEEPPVPEEPSVVIPTDPRTYEQKVEKKPDEDGYTPTPEEQPDGAHTLRDRVTELEKQNQMLIQCLMEMSQIVYA